MAVNSTTHRVILILQKISLTSSLVYREVFLLFSVYRLYQTPPVYFALSLFIGVQFSLLVWPGL